MTRNGQAIEIVWEKGRQLTRYNGHKFTYNASGIRTGKTLPDGTEITYYLDGAQILAEETRDAQGALTDTVYYQYGVDGITGFKHNGTTYLYSKNIQGDITHIYGKEPSGKITLKAEYKYDGFGNREIIKDTNGIGVKNAFGYRSYYYDASTNMYYLQSRYYSPELNRFLNADKISYLDPETLNGLNLYAYCGNNPVMYLDPDGYFFFSFLLVLGIAALAGAVVGVGGQFVGDLATSLFTGKWHFSSWEEYLGSAIGGAVGGMLSLIPGFGLGAAIIGGTLGTFSGLAIGKATGSNTMSWGDIGIQTAISFGINVLTAGITKYARIPGITKGSHSFAQVWNSGVTKVFNHGMSMSLKTAAKGFVSTMVSSFGVSSLLGAGVQGFINAQFIIGTKQRDAYRRKMFPWLA